MTSAATSSGCVVSASVCRVGCNVVSGASSRSSSVASLATSTVGAGDELVGPDDEHLGPVHDRARVRRHSCGVARDRLHLVDGGRRTHEEHLGLVEQGQHPGHGPEERVHLVRALLERGEEVTGSGNGQAHVHFLSSSPSRAPARGQRSATASRPRSRGLAGWSVGPSRARQTSTTWVSYGASSL